MMADEWKNMLTGLFIMLGVLILAMLVFNEYGCAASKPAIYESELAACTYASHTLEESIQCENSVRKSFGRPLREMLKDAGVKDASATDASVKDAGDQ